MGACSCCCSFRKSGWCFPRSPVCVCVCVCGGCVCANQFDGLNRFYSACRCHFAFSNAIFGRFFHLWLLLDVHFVFATFFFFRFLFSCMLEIHRSYGTHTHAHKVLDCLLQCSSSFPVNVFNLWIFRIF